MTLHVNLRAQQGVRSKDAQKQLSQTLSVGPVEVWTCHLPHGSPVLYQLS